MGNYNEAQQLLQQLKPIINQCIETHPSVNSAFKGQKAVVWEAADTQAKTVKVKLLGDIFNPDIEPLTLRYNLGLESFLSNAIPKQTIVWVYYNYSLNNAVILYDGSMSIGNNSINPNLLINPDSAINQRGITTLLNGVGFMSDHWYKSVGGNYVQIDIQDGIYTITTKNNYTSASRVFGQIVENGIALRGKTVTFSVNVLNEQPNYYFLQIYVLNANKTVIANSTATLLNRIGLNYITYTIPTNAFYVQANIVIGLANAPINSFVRFEEPKLEIGVEPTPYSPPNPAEELLKCQRYYQVQNYSAIALSTYQMYNPSVKFLTMRTIPTPVLRAISDTGNISQEINTIYDLTTHTEINIGRTIQYVTVNSGIINSVGLFTVNHIYLFQVAYDAEL